LNVDFSCPSADPLGSRRPALSGIKDGYLPKKWLLYRFILKKLQMDADILFIITSTSDELFNGVLNDLELPK